MYEPQGFMDLQDNSGFGDPNSWLSGEADSSPTLRQTQSSLSAASAHSPRNGNLDRRLFNDLVEMVPLIEHLIDQKGRSSFTRRGSVVYTKTPSKETRKIPDPRGRIASHSLPPRKKRDQSKNASGDQDGENLTLSSKAVEAEREELTALRVQVEDLQKKLVEKDELLKAAEMSKSQMSDVHAKLYELRRLAAEKDSLIKSMQLQLSDAKIQLADKQAVLEKMQWEASTSCTKAEKIQEQLNAAQGDISLFMRFFEGLAENVSQKCHDGVHDVNPYHFEPLPYLDDLDETDFQKMEEAREAYIATVSIAKERQDQESLAVAARARSYLQSFVFKSQNIRGITDFASIAI